MEHDNSVLWYTPGVLRMPVYFPQNKCDCRHCIRFCRPIEGRGLFRCSLLEVTIDLDQLDSRHPECPIDFSEF